MKNIAFRFLFCVSTATVLLAASSCSDDDDNDYRIDFTDAQVSGTWTLSSVTAENQLPRDSLTGATVTFSAPTYSMSKGGTTLSSGTYRVARYYVAIRRGGVADEDTLHLVNPNVDQGHQLVLRHYDRADRTRTVTYTLQR